MTNVLPHPFKFQEPTVPVTPWFYPSIKMQRVYDLRMEKYLVKYSLKSANAEVPQNLKLELNPL